MNRYEYICQVDDLGVTVIENTFINHYMPEARGDFVKVYLYALKCAGSLRDAAVSDAQIAATLKISEQDVINAWNYWKDEKVISIVYEGDDKCIRFENLASLFFGGKKITPTEIKPSVQSSVEGVLKEIEGKISRLLTHSERDKILSWIDEYNISPNSVLLLIEDCLNRDKHSVNYWETIAKTFYDEGITTYDQALSYLEQRDSKWGTYKEIMNYLGLFRPVSTPEKAMIDKWLEEYKLDMDTIKLACDQTVGANRPSLKYVDLIIDSMRNGTALPEKKTTSKRKGPRRTGTERNYDYDELEKYLVVDLDDVDYFDDEDTEDANE
ncbi:MAG: DnaD domain protein [Anaerofustis stercorihominis]|nr:DnaD domain protein [Anaerofustis stercorihominis]